MGLETVWKDQEKGEDTEEQVTLEGCWIEFETLLQRAVDSLMLDHL